MRNISPLKKAYEDKYAQKFCNVNSISECPNAECTCKVAAEIKAYIQAILPFPYYNYTLNDFTGKHNGVKLLSNKLAVDVKGQIVSYCWGNSMTLKDFNKLTSAERNSRSYMDNRRREGKNVVIFSDAESYGVKHKKTGKTFVASLIMQEAIKRRSNSENFGQTYDWLEFPSLIQAIKMSNDSLLASQYCDWLVIDDINNNTKSEKAGAYIASLMDGFLFERISGQLPTILVCRFNITKGEIEGQFGTAVSKIINDPQTVKIELSDKE